jgi:hypothetical protein
MNGISQIFYCVLTCIYISDERTRYIIRFFYIFLSYRRHFLKTEVLSVRLDVVVALTWAKLELSLWNFNIMLVWCGASGKTLSWLLLLVYEGPRTTHFTGYCCRLCEVLGNALYWASLGLMWGAFINGFKIISVGFRIPSVTAAANIPSQTKSHGTAFLFPN